MQAIELMLGDWVFYPKTQEYCKVTTIHNKYLYCFPKGSDEKHSYGLREESVSPIPLTVEILEKNGFNETFWGGEWTNDNIDFILIEHNDGFRMIDTNIVLSGVHHFQHALRLCNIKKDIEL